MVQVYIYNPDTNKVEVFFREEYEAMPYNVGNSLTVGEFRGSSRSSVFWTDKRTMEAFNVLRAAWGAPIFVGFAFKRIWEGGHGTQSQHYAGMALDMGQNLSSTQRNALRRTATDTGVWSYVEPAYLTPTWVHVDKRLGPPACAAGYPALKRGDKGVYVLTLQDALNAIGVVGSGLDGIFGVNTEKAVKQFQSNNGLSSDGIVGCNTWQALTSQAKGIGLTDTVVDP